MMLLIERCQFLSGNGVISRCLFLFNFSNKQAYCGVVLSTYYAAKIVQGRLSLTFLENVLEL